jgi:cytochrome P450
LTAVAFDRLPTSTSFSEAELVLRNRDLMVGMSPEADPVMDHVLQRLHGDEHFDRRRMESVLFRKELLARYEMESLLPALRQEMERALSLDPESNAVPTDLLIMARTALTRQTAGLVGLDGVNGEDAANRLRVIAERLRDAAAVTWSTRDHAEVMREAVHALEELRSEFYVPSLARRRLQSASGEDKDGAPDLLTLLLRHHGQDWDEELWLRETALFVLASSGTLSNAISYAVVELEGWFAGHPQDRGLTGDIDFLTAAASESLRLHPSPPFLARVAVNDTIVGNTQYRAGEYLRIDLGAVNRDQAVFGPDAAEFNPHRKVETTRLYGLAFGGGAHMCIGRPLAMGPHTGDHDLSSAVGGLVRLFDKLYRAGVRLDPEHPPQHSPEVFQHLFLSVPVVFTTLREALDGW